MLHRPSTTLRILTACFWVQSIAACEFKFDVTSQRTALENQVMGSYKELEDDLVLVSSVRAVDAATSNVSASKKKALDARLNQDFNRDDVDELKDSQVLGEKNDGSLIMLPSHLAAASKASASQKKLAESLVVEENRDREEIWRRIISSNENLSAKDLPEVRRTYAKMQREHASSGHWIQSDEGHWQQKASSKQAKDL